MMLLALLFALTTPTLGWAAGVVVGTNCHITWKASPSANLKEYRLYVSQIPGVYQRTPPTATVPVPTTQSTCQALGLPKDGQYYLVVTAVALSGVESRDSNEVPFMRDTSIPEPPTGVVVTP
jgi:hypothetical protein